MSFHDSDYSNESSFLVAIQIAIICMPSNDFDPSFTDRYLGLPLFSNYWLMMVYITISVPEKFLEVKF